MLAVVIIVIVAVTIYSLATAPEGYQDETGFHYGRHPDDDFF